MSAPLGSQQPRQNYTNPNADTIESELRSETNAAAVALAEDQHMKLYWARCVATLGAETARESFVETVTRATGMRSMTGETQVSFCSTPRLQDQPRLRTGAYSTKWTIQDGTCQFAEEKVRGASTESLRPPPTATGTRPRSPSPLREVQNMDSTSRHPGNESSRRFRPRRDGRSRGF